MGIKFDKNPISVEQNNYLTTTVNVYIVDSLAAWQSNPTNFKFKNGLFRATNTAIKKSVYIVDTK